MSDGTAQSTGFRFTVPSGTMLRVLRNGLEFTAADDTLPMLCGVHVALDGTTLTVQATNRYATAEETCTVTGAAGSGSFILPRQDVKSLTGRREWRNDDLLLEVSYDSASHKVTVDGGDAGQSTVDPVPLAAAEWPRLGPFLSGGKKAGVPAALLRLNPALLARFTAVVPAEVPEALARNAAEREQARRAGRHVPDKLRAAGVLVPMAISPNGGGHGIVTVTIGTRFRGAMAPVREN